MILNIDLMSYSLTEFDIQVILYISAVMHT